MPEQASYIPEIARFFAVPDASDVFLVVGGILTSVSIVLEAHEILGAATGLMVRQPLARYRNPLALCDYHTEAAPYRERFYSALTFRGKGAAGRPATKHAFMCALRMRSGEAMVAAPLVRAMPLAAEAYAAMQADVSYVMAMSKMAVTILERQHQWRLRSELRQAQQAAISACGKQRGAFVCEVANACGTGACRFAEGIYAAVDVPAGGGRTARPANHTGTPFSSDTALAELERRIPFVMTS